MTEGFAAPAFDFPELPEELWGEIRRHLPRMPLAFAAVSPQFHGQFSDVIRVHDQEQLEAALNDAAAWCIVIEGAGLTVTRRSVCGARIVALSDVHITKGEIRARDNAHVTASGTASVQATGQAQATAYDEARVYAKGHAQVAGHNQAVLCAWDEVQVTAHDNATVFAYGQSRVTAHDQAAVEAHEQAIVHADGRVQVVVRDQATVFTYEEAQVITRDEGH
ncbi:hypothetical protein ACFQ78_38685 [Streptomyces sp. NPDC056519]|uniref:hypothetical protein n=1 Tax=Streptomyces sp. NPDC056519 TaxID=3345849 RepID=UPI0036AA6F75